jgi:hypothetical protein
MGNALAITISLVTLLATASTLYLAIVRFGLKRERATFLRITVDAAVTAHSGVMALVSVVVRLENKGDTRINARTQKSLKHAAPFLYDDNWDQCEHAGTLKVRSIPTRQAAWTFDWYALPALAGTLERCTVQDRPHQVAPRLGDFEQINYLGEYQDPAGNYQNVDFWLEPHETYDLVVPLWLPPGAYAIKAFFFGQRVEHGEEELWSCTNLLNISPVNPV